MSALGAEPTVTRRDLFGVPVATIVRRSPALGGACVKSAIAFRTGAEAMQTVFGFGFADAGEPIERAVKSSQFESLERLFSRPSLYGARLRERVPVSPWGVEVDAEPRRSMALSEVCVQPGEDSTGLAIHTDPARAQRHAVAELLERHLLGALWYESSLGIARVPELGAVRGRYSVDCYVPVGAEPLPLAVAVVTCEGEGLALCGASLDPSVRRAAARATAEALMLLDGQLQRDRGQSNSPASAARLAALGRRGRALLGPLVADAPSIDADEVPRRGLAALAAATLGAVEVATPEVRGGLYLCRARARSARTLLERRRSRRSDQPLDPFC